MRSQCSLLSEPQCSWLALAACRNSFPSKQFYDGKAPPQGVSSCFIKLSFYFHLFFHASNASLAQRLCLSQVFSDKSTKDRPLGLLVLASVALLKEVGHRGTQVWGALPRALLELSAVLPRGGAGGGYQRCVHPVEGTELTVCGRDSLRPM